MLTKAVTWKDIRKPIECLRIVLLERITQAVGNTGLVANQSPALFDQVEQFAHLCTLRLERLENIAVMEEQLQGVFRIGGIILCSTGFESLAVLRQCGRVDWKEYEEIVLLQRIDDGSFGQFQCHGDGATETLVHRGSPFLDAVHGMWELTKFSLLAVGGLQTNVVLGVRPIDANEGRVILVG